MIYLADTVADTNFDEYENDYVYLIKMEPGDDHWLTHPPDYIFTKILKKS